MQNTVEHVEETPSESEGLIKTPRQLIITVILAFLVPIISIILLVKLASFTTSMGAGSTAQSPESIAQRIQPVAGFKLVDADAPTESKTGEQVFESTCAACHTAGVAGAPKIGDNADWAPLIESGFDEMLRIAIEGKGAMPPRGGNPTLSDLEVARAVVYMANKSGASYDEPTEEGAAGGDQTEADQGADAQAADQPQAAADGDADQAAGQESADAEQPAEQASQTQEQGTEAAAADQAGDAAANQSSDSSEQAGDQQPKAKEADAAAADTAEIDPAGEKLYNAVCFACHTTGVAGAPKIGDKDAWAPYVETGIDTMLEKAITGVGAMPPRGGSQASDEELKASIEYILSTLD